MYTEVNRKFQAMTLKKFHITDMSIIEIPRR